MEFRTRIWPQPGTLRGGRPIATARTFRTRRSPEDPSAQSESRHRCRDEERRHHDATARNPIPKRRDAKHGLRLAYWREDGGDGGGGEAAR